MTSDRSNIFATLSADEWRLYLSNFGVEGVPAEFRRRMGRAVQLHAIWRAVERERWEPASGRRLELPQRRRKKSA